MISATHGALHYYYLKIYCNTPFIIRFLAFLEGLWGFGAVLATTEWLIECVATYSCVPLYDYMSHPVLKLCLSSLPCVNTKLSYVPDYVQRVKNPPKFGTIALRG
jgi:hypothetical protein